MLISGWQKMNKQNKQASIKEQNVQEMDNVLDKVGFSMSLRNQCNGVSSREFQRFWSQFDSNENVCMQLHKFMNGLNHCKSAVP